MIGDVVVRFYYDGLGRLIKAEGSDTEHYYYDGVRRIQTNLEETSGPDTTKAEYVYGPDYVDEFILQSYRVTGGNQQPMYMLQDANYNIVALVNETGQILEQYTWQPYGTLAAIDTNATPAPDNRIGHQGLFCYRLDGSTTFATNATGLYYNRNRWYSPHLGRFISRDPNETGMLLVGVLAINGQALQSLVSAFSPEGHFTDGINLYVYLNSNPINPCCNTRCHVPAFAYQYRDNMRTNAIECDDLRKCFV